MTRLRRPSAQTIAVLLALAEEPATWRYGCVRSRRLDVKDGTMYPILIRLADRDLLETAWESDPPPGRPARHLYRLTGKGLAMAADLAEEPSAVSAPGATGWRVRWEGV
ncbi:MAG: PadR family transcriptional regulator [Hamadaea sp.]|nr:PadR family transcriptional regulator [Hamadaea sp.]